MMKKSVIVIVVVIGGLCGCGHRSQYLTRDGELTDSWSAVSDRTYIRTVGIGVAPDSVKDRTRRKGMARNSALINARTELIAMIKTVRIKGSLEVSRLAEQRGIMRLLVDSTIGGAEEERVEWDNSEGCIVVLRIARSRVRKMLQDTARAEAAESDETIAALEKQIAIVDGRTRALLTALPGIRPE